MSLYGIVGYGGFGREVAPIASHMLSSLYKGSDFQVVFVEKEPSDLKINGYAVFSEDEFFSSPRSKYFNIAIADHVLRKKVAEKYIKKNVEPFSIVAQNSLNVSDNEIGEGAILCPFTMVTANAKIGKYFHSNIYSYVAHDCIIGDYVTFAPGVRCNGNVIIEDGAYIGTGAIIRHGSPEKPLVIGAGAVVGMGAVVTKNVAPNTTVVGNPAKIFEK